MVRSASFLFAAMFCVAASGQQAAFLNPTQPAIGTFNNNRFHHTSSGTEFSVPPGWILQYQGPSSGGGDQVAFTFGGSSDKPLISAFIWMKKQGPAPPSIGDQLRSAIDFKAGQRQGMFGDYRMLKDTVENRTVAGQAALSVRAHFVQDGENMTEYHTWAISSGTSVYVSARMNEADFARLRPNVDQIVDSLLIP